MVMGWYEWEDIRRSRAFRHKVRGLGEKIGERRIHGIIKKGEEDIIRKTWAMKRRVHEMERHTESKTW